MSPTHKRIVWLRDRIASPPFSDLARGEAGWLLRRVQAGEVLGMPHSRPMPTIGRRCHELRVRDARHLWRIFYRTDPDAIVVSAVFDKDTQATPKHIIDACKGLYRRYDEVSRKTGE